MPDIKKFLDQAGTSYLWSKIAAELNKKANSADLANVATSGAASDVSITDSGNHFDSTTVEGALQEIGTAIATAGTVTIESEAGQGDILTSYTFSQNGRTIGTINIPKDLVVTSGSVEEASTENPINGNTSGTYLVLTIANQQNPVYIAATDLVDIYTAVDTSEIDMDVTNGEISATLKNGSIGKARLSSTVQASLDLADSALQEHQTVTLESGTNNGTVKLTVGENSTDNIAITGLGTAAFTDASAYDAAGAASAVLGASTDAATANTVYGAKAYADSLASNYDAAGAASAILGTAQDSAGTATVYGIYNTIQALTTGDIDTAITNASNS